MSKQTRLVFLFLFIVACLLMGGEKSASNENAGTPHSVTGVNILKRFQHAIVVNYEEGDIQLYGFSANPNGRRIKSYMNLDKEQAEKLRDLCLDPQNLILMLRVIKANDNRNMNQGVEFTNGAGFVRIQFTEDAEFCSFFTSSGEVSPILTCSDNLKAYAKKILESRDNAKMIEVSR